MQISREDIDEIDAGDIAAVLGLKESFTGEQFATRNNPIILGDD